MGSAVQQLTVQIIADPTLLDVLSAVQTQHEYTVPTVTEESVAE